MKTLEKGSSKHPNFISLIPDYCAFCLAFANRNTFHEILLLAIFLRILLLPKYLKHRYNAGLMPDMYFFRDTNGNEVDLLITEGRSLIGIEIKSSFTFSMKQLARLRRLRALTENLQQSYLIYNGQPVQLSDGSQALYFKNTGQIS